MKVLKAIFKNRKQKGVNKKVKDAEELLDESAKQFKDDALRRPTVKIIPGSVTIPYPPSRNK